MNCSFYLPVDHYLIPTGEIKAVNNTPFDFRKVKSIGQEIESAGDYDHCFVFRMEKGDCEQIAMAFEPNSRREMTIATTEPAVQLYCGKHLDSCAEQGFNIHDGFTLETQLFPDAVNQAGFPSTILNPGDIYKQRTKYEFGTR